VTLVDRSRLPEVGRDPAFAIPAIVRHTLPNGLQVRTIEHRSVPVITFVLSVEAGSAADPPAQEGLAALTADMADEGTGALTAIDVSEMLARIGAEYDVEVAPDTTFFTLTTLARFAGRGASLLADITTRPSLRDDDVARVRQLRLDRLRQMKDVPPAVAERAFLRLLYGTHPYGHLAIGGDATLRALSRDMVTAFHRATYRPDASVLIVTGAFNHDELLRIASDAFGEWRSSGSDPAAGPRASDVAPVEREPVRLAIVPRDGAAQSELRIGHLAARRDTPDYAALLVMNAVLGGQFVSRVNLKLREEKGYTYGARTGFDWHRGLSPFGLQVSVHTASTADAIRDALDELDAIRGRRPPTDEELALAKASLTRGYARNFETAQQVARSVAQLALYGLPDTYFEEFVPNVNAVAGEDVRRVAERYIRPERLSTLVVGDHRVVGDAIDDLGLGDAVVLPLEM
jgi:predicted Zn-dependent peptidase